MNTSKATAPQRQSTCAYCTRAPTDAIRKTAFRLLPEAPLTALNHWQSQAALVALLALSSLPAWPQDAGTLLRQQEQYWQQQLPQQPAQQRLDQPSSLALLPPGGAQVTITELIFSGTVTLLSDTERTKLQAQTVGQTLDFAGLQDVAGKVMRQLQQKGYMLAQAYLPQQDVTQGRLEITLLEGVLEGWEFETDAKVRTRISLLESLAHGAAPTGKPLTRQALERALLLMNDLPAINASARLEPGEAYNTSRLISSVRQDPVIAGTVWANNHGNPATGRHQGSALLNANDPLGAGEQVTLLGTYSEGIRLGRLGGEVGMGSHGLRVSSAITLLHYNVVDGDGEPLDLSGQTRVVRAGVSYPLVRTRRHNLHLGLDADAKSLTDRAAKETLRDKRVTSGTLRLSGDRVDDLGFGGFTSWSVDLTYGDLDLSRSKLDEAIDALTLQTAGDFSKATVRLLRLQQLPNSFSLVLQAAGQWAADNLDSSESFVLDGPYGVRAYPGSEASGDSGWVASAELRYELPPILPSLVSRFIPFALPWGDFQLVAFYDTGGIRLNQNVPDDFTIPNATGRNHYRLSGTGFAVRVQQTKRYLFEAVWARPVGSNPGRRADGRNADGNRDSSRFWLQSIIQF